MCVSAKTACTRTGSSGSSRAVAIAFECIIKSYRRRMSPSMQTNKQGETYFGVTPFQVVLHDRSKHFASLRQSLTSEKGDKAKH